MSYKTEKIIEDGKEYKIQIYNEGHNIFWFLNGKRHREKGPAITYKDGYKAWCKAWFQNDRHHRLDGPARIYPSGTKYWYINDIGITEQAHTKVRTMLTLGLNVI
jgi:hypothetical protein